MIPLTVVEMGDAAIRAAETVLRSGMLVQGAQVAAFENALAARTGRRHAVAVSSGTAALSLALATLDLQPDDEVLCPALTWPSPAHAVLAAGASLALVDVDPHAWNATPQTLAAGLRGATRAAIVIDQFGNPAQHDAIAEALPDIPCIVDAACALGSAYQGTPCGGHGLIACLSFHPRKLLTTGEGGACLTDDDALAERLRALRNHGQRGPGDFICAAGNYRMTEMAAAIGLAQLQALDGQLTRLRALFAHYHDGLKAAGVSLQQSPTGGTPNHQTLGVLVGEPGDDSRKRDACIDGLRERGVGAGRLSYALHTLPQLAEAAAEARAAGRSLSHAADVAQRGLALPLYPSMQETQVDQVIEALCAVQEAS